MRDRRVELRAVSVFGCGWHPRYAYYMWVEHITKTRDSSWKKSWGDTPLKSVLLSAFVCMRDASALHVATIKMWMNYWAQTKPDPLTLEFNEGVESGVHVEGKMHTAECYFGCTCKRSTFLFRCFLLQTRRDSLFEDIVNEHKGVNNHFKALKKQEINIFILPFLKIFKQKRIQYWFSAKLIFLNHIETNEQNVKGFFDRPLSYESETI